MTHPLLIVKARYIVRHSHLSDQDKQLMLERIPFIDAKMLGLFVQSADENPFALDAIVKSMKQKLETSGNLSHLRDVIDREAREAAHEDFEEEEEEIGEVVSV